MGSLKIQTTQPQTVLPAGIWQSLEEHPVPHRQTRGQIHPKAHKTAEHMISLTQHSTHTFSSWGAHIRQHQQTQDLNYAFLVWCIGKEILM